MPSSTQASIACELKPQAERVLGTCQQLIDQQTPNFFRLHLNPQVAQACYVLSTRIAEVWSFSPPESSLQIFLSGSHEEALSGAIKLARYDNDQHGRPGRGLLLNWQGEIDHFASSRLRDGHEVVYLPGVEVVDSFANLLVRADLPEVGFLYIPQAAIDHASPEQREQLANLRHAHPEQLLLVGAARTDLTSEVSPASDRSSKFVPSIVVCDETIADQGVPGAAFAAPRTLFDHWNKRGMTTFHSTTYQPNAITATHILHTLQGEMGTWFETHRTTLDRLERDSDYRRQVYGNLYSSSLAKLSQKTGLDQATLKCDGNFITTNDVRIFDAVAGVACSIRGHNPPSYVAEVRQTGTFAACQQELSERLAELTGLACAAPAVSGAAAVEHGLKIALASQAPKNHVIALKGGFGGKTLFALTGTWQQKLKAGLDPLYPHVSYVDPQSPDAAAAVERLLQEHDVAVLQLELVQGVGGVRPIPTELLRQIVQLRDKYQFLLLVDEVQTGVFRTGPFVRSKQLGITPDLITIGKAISDMMFPFALTLYSDEVQQRLRQNESDLPQVFADRYGYEIGYRTLLNTLRRAERDDLATNVVRRGEHCATLLRERLSKVPRVREVRTFGLLLGIELIPPSFPGKFSRKLYPQLCLLGMLKHARYPVLAGFCQYEPHILKITPPLTINAVEADSMCDTIATVLSMPLWKLLAGGLALYLGKNRGHNE